VICYELVTGRLPHDVKGKPAWAGARVIREEEPIPLRSASKGVSRDLDAIVGQALAKDRARRYQSAADLAADLERYLNEEPVKARRTGAGYRCWKFARRHRAGVSVAGALLLALAGGSWLMALTFLQRERAELAERERARLEADGFVQAARLASQQGNWRDARANYDRALTTDRYRDSVSVRLNKVRAQLALNDTEECLREIEGLAEAPDLGAEEGSVRLLHGEILLGRDDVKAEQLIRLARACRLPPGEEAYARALLAANTVEAVDLLRQALALDPYRLRARSNLELLLLLLARFDEAGSELSTHEVLFREDVDAKILRALLLALKGQPAEADALLARLPGAFPERDRAALRALARFVAEFQNRANRPARHTGLPELDKHWAQLQRELQLLGFAGKGNRWAEVIAPLQTLSPFSHLPPRLRTNLVGVLDALEKTSDGMNAPVIAAPVVAEATAAARVHPEGTVLYFQALAVFGAHRWHEADAVALRAAETAPLLPVRRLALFVAAASEGMQYYLAVTALGPALQLRGLEALLQVQQPGFSAAAALHGLQPAAAEALLRRAVGNLREMLTLGPRRPLRMDVAVALACVAREYGLARQLLDDLEKDATPAERVQLLPNRFQVEFQAGAYGHALKAADEYLKQKPDDPVMKRRREEAVQKLLEQARPFEPDPAARR
jgi:hypothetical protein